MPNRHDFEQLMDEWASLRLEVLTPAPLGRKEVLAFLRGRENKYDPTFLFYCSGMEVAALKPAIVADVMKSASTFQRTVTCGVDGEPDCLPDDMMAVGKFYCDDTDKMNNVLMRATTSSAFDAEIGRFTDKKSHTVHIDGPACSGLAYTLRVGALEILVVNGKDHRRHRQDVAAALWKAPTPEFMSLGVLRPFPINRVLLAITKACRSANVSTDQGTPHGSSPVPPDGAVAGFMRSIKFG